MSYVYALLSIIFILKIDDFEDAKKICYEALSIL